LRGGNPVRKLLQLTRANKQLRRFCGSVLIITSFYSLIDLPMSKSNTQYDQVTCISCKKLYFRRKKKAGLSRTTPRARGFKTITCSPQCSRDNVGERNRKIGKEEKLKI